MSRKKSAKKNTNDSRSPHTDPGSPKPPQGGDGSRPDFQPLHALHDRLQEHFNSQLDLIWAKPESAGGTRLEVRDVLQHPLYKGRLLQVVPIQDVCLLYFGSDWHYDRFQEVSREILDTLCEFNADEGRRPNGSLRPGTPDGAEPAPWRSLADALAEATGGDDDLVSHFWPYYMLRWVRTDLAHVPFLTTRCVTEVETFGRCALTLLERDLFSASSLVLNAVTDQTIHTTILNLEASRRVVISGDVEDARRAAAAGREALPALEAIRDRVALWDDVATNWQALSEHLQKLNDFADLLQELGMTFRYALDGCFIQLGPRSRLVPAGGDPELRITYEDCFRLMCQLVMYEGVVLPVRLKAANDLFVERFADVVRRLGSVAEVDSGPTTGGPGEGRGPSEISEKGIVGETEDGDPPGGESGTPYLGLVLDCGNRRVTRPGRPVEVVEFRGRKLLWELFRQLHEAGDDYLAMELVYAVWTGHGVAERPEKRTVEDSISDLRKLLQPLGVTVRNSRGVGYMLCDLDPGPASRS
ncbi:MAG: hypothetical protein U0835_25330 [Isosphaeraceae bacterium]